MQRPELVTLTGKHVQIVPLDAAAHGPALYAGSRDAELWSYLFNGPYTNEHEFQTWLAQGAPSDDRRPAS